MKIAIIISTNGGVLSALIKTRYFRDKLALVISDRACGAIDLAKENNIPTVILSASSGIDFSSKLSDYFKKNHFDLYVSFYTRLFSPNLTSELAGFLINMHPSILPSFKGLNGFEDAMNNSTKFIGTTIHFVDSGMDTGTTLIQSSIPKDESKSEVELRHELFLDQCMTLLQVVDWVLNDRIFLSLGKYVVKNAQYTSLRYSPSLELELAKNFKI